MITNLPEKLHWITPEESMAAWIKSWDPELREAPFASGFKTHDQGMGWFHRGSLYIYGARPGIGKTAMLLALAVKQTVHSTVYYLNLEMSHQEMWSRLYCLVTPDAQLGPVARREKSMRWAALQAAPQLQRFTPLWLENTDFNAFVKLAKETIEPSSRSVLFVDYLGLFSMRGLGPNDSFVMIAEVAKQLKLIARALNIPVIVAAQLNREIEKRKDRSVTLADLRGSGELENHADAVMGLSRENSERMDVTILKNRIGPLTRFDLRFIETRAAIEDWEQ